MFVKCRSSCRRCPKYGNLSASDVAKKLKKSTNNNKLRFVLHFNLSLSFVPVKYATIADTLRQYTCIFYMYSCTVYSCTHLFQFCLFRFGLSFFSRHFKIKKHLENIHGIRSHSLLPLTANELIWAIVMPVSVDAI